MKVIKPIAIFSLLLKNVTCISKDVWEYVQKNNTDRNRLIVTVGHISNEIEILIKKRMIPGWFANGHENLPRLKKEHKEDV